MSIYNVTNTISIVNGKLSATAITEEFAELCFTANTAGSTVELTIVGSPSIANTAYSRDRVTWTTFTPSTTSGTNTITLTNAGDKVYFRNDITANFGTSNYMKFVMSGSIAASGNVNSVYDADGFNDLTTLSYTYCYYNMFNGCTSLTTAPTLPATTLAEYCYYQMFKGCTSLTTAPALPATTLTIGCYRGMFANCSSLTSNLVLPAITLNIYCYMDMFWNCTSLTTIPVLPATTLFWSCYSYMFYGCTSLVSIPELPIAVLAPNCYKGMFSGCTSLTTAPVLSATTLARQCYDSMFYGCTSLTTAPALPATTLTDSCYNYMFYNCSSLCVYSETGTGHTNAWRIPTSGTLTRADSDTLSMFKGTTGDYSSTQYPGGMATTTLTFYTQNQPV